MTEDILIEVVSPMDTRMDWDAVARQVRAHPGLWCRVSRPFNATVAAHIRNGRYTHIRPEEFDVTTRKSDIPNKSWIFLRTKLP